jgi:hypothetical protein
MSELPVELWWTGRDWLGGTRAIAHFPSLRTLMETLSPNRIPAKLDPYGLIVRAEGSIELPHAAREVTDVGVALKAMGIVVSENHRPGIEKLRRAFNKGLRALHFVGHGMAGALGEALPIGAKGELRPSDFSQLGGARTPFAFLNVCELGRARVGAGGSPAGFATRLVEKGAPAVIACLQEVPDRVATDIAIAFYQAASQGPVGASLARARAAMDAVPYPPSCWGAYALYGDPFFELGGRGSRVCQARDRTLGWSDHVARFVTTRSRQERQAALDLLSHERNGADQAERALLNRLAGWVSSAMQPAGAAAYQERLALCRELALSDSAAAASLRMLLAMECLEGLHAAAPSSIIEAHAGLMAGKGAHDTIAWPALVALVARHAEAGPVALEVKPMLDEAEGMLEAWALSEPDVTPMLDQIRERRQALSS